MHSCCTGAKLAAQKWMERTAPVVRFKDLKPGAVFRIPCRKDNALFLKTGPGPVQRNWGYALWVTMPPNKVPGHACVVGSDTAVDEVELVFQ